MKRALPFVALLVVWIAVCARAEIRVQITEVQEGSKAIVSQGADAGIAPGMVFNILGEDGQEVIGTLTVLEVGESHSTGIYYIAGAAAPSAGMQAVFGAAAPAGTDQGAEIIVPKGSIIQIVLENEIGSQISNTGDIVNFTVKVPVQVNGIEVISQGAKAFGEITEAKPAKGYGKSGKLDFVIKFVQAVDGTNVPISFEVENSKGNNYMKAAIGTYVTGLLGGGAMKGKKVTIDKGTEFTVFTPENTTLRSARLSGNSSTEVNIVKREKRAPGTIKVAFLGLHDSYNSADNPGAGFNAEKISVFLSYKLMWESGFDFINPRTVMEQVSTEGLDSYFLKKGDATIPALDRYNVPKIIELGNNLGADYVIVGDILDFTTSEYEKTDKGKTVLNVLSIAGGGSTMDATKKVIEIKASIDMAIMDVKTGDIFWSEKCEGDHKASKLMERTEATIPVVKISGTYYGIVDRINYNFSRMDDPIAFAGTEEGVAVMKILNPFLIELPNLF